jgi:hypothetical protein
MWTPISLRPYAGCYFGEVFGEDPSTFTQFILGVVEVLLDHEDLQVQLQRRCVRKVILVGH